MTNKLALIVAVVLGVMSIVGIRLYVEKIERENVIGQGAQMDVLVASRDIDPGQIFTEEDLTRAEYPSAVVANVFRGSLITESQAIIGAKTATAIRAGQALQTYHFHQRSRDSLADRLSPEHRAITIPVSRITGVGGHVRPLDYVDLLATIEFEDRTGEKLKVTRTVVKNVLVLACDDIVDPFDARSGAGGYATLTLRLTPAECTKIVYCLGGGGGDSTLHCALVKKGTPESPGWNTTVADHLYQEVVREIDRPR